MYQAINIRWSITRHEETVVAVPTSEQKRVSRWVGGERGGIDRREEKYVM